MTRFAIFVFALFMCGAMNVLNAQVEVPKEEQGDEEYINWSTAAYSAFIVHPNGNLIVNRANEFYELDAKTGKELRAFPVQYGFQDYINTTVSPDGKYFAYTLYGDSTVTFIIDYESGEVYKKLKGLGQEVSFLNNTQLLVERFGKGIGVYTFGNDSTVQVFSYGPNIFTGSPDGSTVALAINAKESSGSPVYTWFELWNAAGSPTRVKSIKHKEKMEIYDIKFSLDGKYVGYYAKLDGIYIYNLPDFSLKRKYPYSYGDYAFLGNDLIAFSPYRTVHIRNLNDTLDSLFFIFEGKGGGGIGYSQAVNSLYIRGNGLHSFNLTKILANVSVENIESTQIFVDYSNGTLSISNLSPLDNKTIVKVIDLAGNVVFQFPLDLSQEGSFSIPISLPVGAYILSIDEQVYKFLVLE